MKIKVYYKQRLIFTNNKREMKESEYEWFAMKLEEYLLKR